MARDIAIFGKKIRKYVNRLLGLMSCTLLTGCHCVGFFQDQTLIAVSNSYEAIRPAVAAKYLGLDPQAADKADPPIIQKFTNRGWTWNSETRLLHPSPITVPPTDPQPTSGIRETMSMLGNR